MPGPLHGIRIFDMTTAMNGPWAAMLLGSMGADVLHIVQPNVDWSRLAGGPPPTINGTSSCYIAWNMNKRGVFIDLKDPDGQAFARDLIATCDVFMNNMRSGVAERLGLSYDALCEVRPDIVYVAATGFGKTGPMSHMPALDTSIQSLSGFTSVTGARGGQGEINRHTTQLDATTSNVMVQAVLLALYSRKRTGKGQFIDITMLEASATLQSPRLSEFFAGYQHRPQASSSYVTAPDRAFRCADRKWIGVSVTAEEEWLQFCQATCTPELLDDPRFRANALRVEHREELEALLEPVFAAKPQAYWILRFGKAGVACGGPISWEELRYHAQSRDNDYLIEVETPVWGTVWMGGPPWRFSKTPARVFSAPIPGNDTYDLIDEIQQRKEGEL